MKKLLLSSFLFFTGVIMAMASGHVASITPVTVTCHGACNGAAVGHVTGGVGPYGYSWTGASSFSALGQTITGLCPGSYTLTVTDSSDMSIATASSTITEPMLLMISIPSSYSVCAGSCISLTPVATGGSPPYTYNWVPIGTGTVSSPIVCPTGTTTYTLTASDGNGCAGVGSTTVTVNPLDDASFNYSSSNYCIAAAPQNPTITGLPGGTFTGAGVTSSTIGTFDPAVAGSGTFTVTYTTSGTCSNSSSVNVTIDSMPSVSLPASYAVCSGSAVTLGGSPLSGYSYGWLPGTSLSSTGVSNPACAPLVTTTYTLTVTEGTCSATASTVVNVDGPITTGITSTHTSSCGACDGTALVTATGGTGVYTYAWMPSGVTVPSVSGLCAGMYLVDIIDAVGCAAMDSIKVLGPPITADFTMVPDSSNSLNYWAFNTSTGAGLSYIWYFGDGDSSFVSSPAHMYATAGTYNVCLIVSVPGGCFDVKCTTITVTGIPSPCLSLFNITHDTASTNPNAYTVYNLSYGATLTYLWDFGDGTTSVVRDPMHVYSGTGAYQICLTVDNGSGCNHMYCDSLIWVDSISRASIPLSVTVVDGPPFPYSTTGIAEQASTVNSIDVYPNPFTDVTTFSIKTAKLNAVYSFEMTDVLGKKIRSLTGITDKQFQISRNGLETGIYFYKIYDAENLVGIGKVVIK